MRKTLVALWLVFVGAVIADAAPQNRESVKSQAFNGPATGSNKASTDAISLPPPGGNRRNITGEPTHAPPGSVKVTSKQGRALARMQNKRQADGTQWLVSRRNEDPWFLDQPPYPLQPYRFVYNIKGKNGQTEQYRQEVGDGKFLSGSYGYVLPDGIYRHVDYIADERGFRAFIRTSEPGTANENPANVVIASTPVVGAPGVTYARQSADELGVPVRSASLPPAPPSNIYSAPPGLSKLALDPWTNRNRDDLDQVRRAPGSIVGTSLRNFTSYSFTTAHPLLLQRSAVLESKQPTASNLAGPRLFQQQADDDNQFGRPNRPGPAQHEPSGDQFGHIQQTVAPATPPPFHLRPVQAEVRDQPGSSLLTYDQPLGFQASSGPDSSKLAYDNKHTFHPDAPVLAQERARGLAQLERMNAAGIGPALHYLHPPPADLGLLAPPISLSPDRQLVGKSRIETSSSRSSTSSSSSSSSSSTSGLSADGRLIALGTPTIFNKMREQSSGTKSGSVRELELYQHRANASEQDAPLQLVPVPAPPSAQPVLQLSSAPREPASPASPAGPASPARAGAAGVKGRLQAPYADFGATSVNSPAPASDEKPTAATRSGQQQATGSQPDSADQESGRAAWSQPDRDEREREKEREPVRRHLDQGHWLAGLHVRSADTPEARDFRSSLAMNDLRSMQNMLGLPQPPRVRPTSALRRSSHEAGEWPRTRAELGEKLVSARMERVGALLSSAPALQTGVGSAASAARSSTLAAESNEVEGASLSPGKLIEATSAAKSRVQTGPVIRLSSGEAPADLSLAGLNDTQFDARRLNSRDRAAAKLHAEKLSELEKFQQRLKAQQLLLEQAKQSSADKQASSANRTASSAGGRPGREQINSQVSYDDDESNELGAKLASSSARPRRQNEEGASSTTDASPPAASSTEAPPAAGKSRAPSELAKQLQRWPSVSAGGSEAPGARAAANDSASERAPRNTVNMEFINSVTSLAADQLNPFAGARAGSSVHRGVATASARYFNSPELLAALDDPARHETSARLQSLFGATGEGGAPTAGSNHWSAAGYLAADSQQHGSFTASPAGAPSRQRPAAALADGFEVRDRALELERFYEVVSSADAGAPVAGAHQHRAFRG